MDGCINSLVEAKVFPALDANSVYWKIEIYPRDHYKAEIQDLIPTLSDEYRPPKITIACFECDTISELEKTGTTILATEPEKTVVERE